MRDLVIVARDQPDVWQYVTQLVKGDEEVEVILDRRQGERRQRLQAHEPEQRKVVRRRPLTSQTDLRYRSLVFAVP